MASLRERLQQQASEVAATNEGGTPRSLAETQLCVSALQKIVALSRDATSAERLLPPSDAIVLIL